MKCGGQKLPDRGLRERAICIWKIDDGIGSAEFEDGLAACTTWLAGRIIEIGNRDGCDSYIRPMQGYSRGDGVLLRAGSEAVGGVLNVAAGDDGTVRKQDSSADAKFAVGRVCVTRGFTGALLQGSCLLWGE